MQSRIITFLILAIVFFSCTKSAEKTTPAFENITESVYAAGFVKAKNQYQVFSTVEGIISKIFVTENDFVKIGSPLVLVSDETAKLTLKNATLAAGYAALNTNEEKLAELRNNIALTQSKYSNDSAIFKRQQNLWNQNIGSRLEVEQKELAAKNAKMAFESAKIRYNEEVRQLTFGAEQSKNNLALSKKNESDFTVKSEIDGKVYSLYRKQPGEMVNPQTALALIGDPNAFLLDLQIDEYDISKIKEGQKVLLSMDSYKGKIFEAKISKIYPLMNEHSKSFSVEAIFVKQPPVLYPNLTVEANIIIQTREKALLIPRSYLVSDSFVLIAKDKRKAVTTGLKDYRKVEIVNGLTINDVIYKPQ